MGKPWSPLAQQKARFAQAAEQAAKANPDRSLLAQFDGFEAHLKAVSSSEAAAERARSAEAQIKARDARIRAQMKKEER
jgi:hypothetical protein